MVVSAAEAAAATTAAAATRATVHSGSHGTWANTAGHMAITPLEQSMTATHAPTKNPAITTMQLPPIAWAATTTGQKATESVPPTKTISATRASLLPTDRNWGWMKRNTT
jgi:hypothetical protein